MRNFFNILFLLLIFNSSFAQTLNPEDIITTSGEYSEGTTLSFSWTLGESMIGITDISKPYVFTQGFQQAYLDEFIISPPKNLVITPVDQQITLSWNPNTESGIHKYNIYRDISSPVTFLFDSVVGSPPDTFYVDTDLIPGETYYYRIIAIDIDNNESGFSNEVSATIANLYIDSLALVALYNSTNGPNWTNNSNWLTGNVSDWYGITVSGDRVTQIGLNSNNLVGTIPAEIGNLTNLTNFILEDNQFSGSISSEIGNLINLTNLSLNCNNLTGSIPAEIGNLTNLTVLCLCINQLTGSIPAEIGNLINLTYLELNENQLSGSIPIEIGNLTNLTNLQLQYNQLSGSIPSEISNLTNSERLYLNDNQFTDLSDLSSLVSLNDLQIQNNQFTFKDIEPNIGVPSISFTYSPQDSVGIETTTKVAIDSSYTMSVEVGGVNNLYQWYLNKELISGATDSLYTISAVIQADYGEYICKITNTLATDLTLYSRPIHLATLGALYGLYTIGPSSPDFLSFTEAVDSLVSAGIAGPVIFNVETGTYNEQIILPEITGTSSTNTITFRSASGDSTDVMLTWASDQEANNFIVKLDGADHVIFRNMTLQATGTDYGRVFNITSDADNNRFLNNQFIGMQTYILHSEEYSAIIYSHAYCDNNIFMYNKFQNGTFGISKCGWDISVELEAGTQILNNEFTDQIFAGIQLAYQDAPIISGNLITADANDQEYRGIECSNCDNGIIIQKNRISSLNNYGGFGVFVNNSNGTPGNEGLIANNFVHVTTSYHAYGILNNNSTYQNYYYNSVNMGTNGYTKAMTVQTGSSDIVIKNNIFANLANENSYTIECIVTSGITSDYNNLYTTGTEFAYWGSEVTDLSDLQTTSGQDANSISVNPEFLSDSDLHTINKTLWAGTPIAEITYDIDGETRNAVKPFIGADEYVFIPSTKNNILTYSFSEQTVKAIINTVNHTVNIEVAYGTDVANLVATFTVSDLATITIGSTPQENGVTANDFITPVTYMVTAENGISQAWLVTVLRERLIFSFPYSEDFEFGKGGWISTGTNNSWQYGTPSGHTIYFAASGNNAWVTNLNGNYNANEISFVKGPVFDLSNIDFPKIEFNVWWDAEGFYDGANFQYKQGTGVWKTLGTDQGDDSWYNNSYIYSIEKGFGFDMNNSAGWTGDDEWGYGSDGWVTVSHALTGIDDLSDVRFRIAFASNSSYQNDGIAIDNITIFDDPTGIDAVNGLLSDIQIYPNPNEGKFRLEYNGESDVDLNLQLINLQGQVILSEQIKTGYRFSKEFELEYLPPGLYYFRLMHKEGVVVKKMVVR